MTFLIVYHQWFVMLLLLVVLLPRRDNITTVTALRPTITTLHLLVGGSLSSSKTKTKTARHSNSIILRHSAATEESASTTTPFQIQVDEKQSSSPQFCCCWRSAFLSTIFLGGVLLLQPLPVHAANDDLSAITAASAIGRDSIAPCNKLVAIDKNGAKNCVSTASVRQLDLYAAPWTFSSSLTNLQVLDYLQQALREADRLVEIDQTVNNESSDGLRATTTRAAALGAKDQLDFYVNRNDRVIQFVSRQVQGPDVSDLGANRRRLEEVRKRTPFGIMGVNDDAGDGVEEVDVQKREGALGQLKAFYGLQSGAGFEGVLLNNDDD